MKTNRFLGFIMSVVALAFAATACDSEFFTFLYPKVANI